MNIFREAREDAGLKIEKVSELVGIETRKLYRIEIEDQFPLPNVFYRLCKVLRISLKKAHMYYIEREL